MVGKDGALLLLYMQEGRGMSFYDCRGKVGNKFS